MNCGPLTFFSGTVVGIPFASSYREDSSGECARGRYCRDSAGRLYHDRVFGSPEGDLTTVLIKDPVQQRVYFAASGAGVIVTPYPVVEPGGWWFPGLRSLRVGSEAIRGLPCVRHELSEDSASDFISGVWICEELMCVMRELGQMNSQPYKWEIVDVAAVEPDPALFEWPPVRAS